MLGWSWARNRSHPMDMEVQVSSNMPQLGTFGDSFTPSWGQRGQEYCFKQLRRQEQNCGKYRWKRAFWKFRIGPAIPPLQAIWTSTWAEVAPTWVQVAAKLRHLRAKLGRSWGQLIQVGPKLGPCWPKLTPSRAHVAATLDRNSPFGRCWADL